MDVDFKCDLTKVWTRTTPNGHAVTDFQFKIPTSVVVNKDTMERRRDTLSGFIFKDMGEEWMAYIGPVKVKGDLRVSRCQKDGVWQCKPEVAVKEIHMIGGGDE